MSTDFIVVLFAIAVTSHCRPQGLGPVISGSSSSWNVNEQSESFNTGYRNPWFYNQGDNIPLWQRYWHPFRRSYWYNYQWNLNVGGYNMEG
ncbi:hypothetical protein Y032_0129g1505 [Ancylostoma ceylanicum]|nr:hypothetical protein Y032_0129g1505 [Ancylostoma ceylanicum]